MTWVDIEVRKPDNTKIKENIVYLTKTGKKMVLGKYTEYMREQYGLVKWLDETSEDYSELYKQFYELTMKFDSLMLSSDINKVYTDDERKELDIVIKQLEIVIDKIQMISK